MREALTEVRMSMAPSTPGVKAKTLQHRAYRAAFFVSLAINVVLIGAIALYLHFAALLDAVEGAVNFLG